MSGFWKDYCYVDAHYEHPTKHIRLPWVRLPARDVAKKIVTKSQGINCFTSVQRYRDATSLRDATKAVEDLAEEERKAEAAKLPEQQNHYHGLYFDFDYDPSRSGLTEEEGISLSQKHARVVVQWAQEMFDLNPAHVQCWFSGRKGFHVVIRPEVFDIRPHMHLTYIVKGVAVELAESYGLTTLDRSVYTVSRMWRIPNTLNPASGKYKIELTIDEMMSMSARDIIDRSIAPRVDAMSAHGHPLASSHIWDEDEYRNISPSREAVTWYQDRYQQYDAYRDLQRLKPRKKIVVPDFGNEPVCVKDIMTNGPKVGGPNRNRVLLPLAGFMHDAGLEKDEANRMVREWTEQFYPDPGMLRDRIRNGQSVVESAYSGQTRFSCRFIRSCGGQGETGRVACVGEEKCDWIAAPDDQEPAVLPMIDLAEASKGCYINTKIRTAVHVAAVAGRPFELPVKGRITCQPDPEAKICSRCPNNHAGGRGNLEFTFGADERSVLTLVNVNDNQRKQAIREKARIPTKCYRNKIEPEEYSNLEEIQVIPVIDYEPVYSTDDDEETTKSAQHVVRIAYFLGHGIQPNRKYIIDAMVYGHPKDQRVCFLFDTMEAAQDDIDQFKLSNELMRKLKIFQVKEGQTVLQKLTEIHQDFTANVHQIGGRLDLSIGIDLCYHSVIGFKLADQQVNKGWFELLVIGDTSTGKSTMVERLQRHFGLGELIAGEESKRTGLVYASIQMQGQWILRWGKVPQNDRRLLVIDEFAGIPQEEVTKMTQLRSEGRARGGGVNTDYVAWARTRLILLTNPRNNRGAMEGFNYGIDAVDDLFKDSADVRRVDLAIIADKSEVDTSLINKRWDQLDMPHVYTADLCKNLILWAWSREPHHVDWGADAVNAVYEWAEILGDTYDCDIPLAERGDLRIKLARISAAVAARVFSTDQEGKKLYVLRDHVDFAAKFMDSLYRKPAMSYFEYAKKFKQDNTFTERKTESVRRHLESYTEDMEQIVTTLLELTLLTRPTFFDMVGLDKDDLNKLWKFIIRERLLKKTARGYRKTGAFTKFLKTMNVKASGYEASIDMGDFQTGGEFVPPQDSDDDDIYEDY